MVIPTETKTETNQTELTPTSGTGENVSDKKWGYDLYPERKGEKYKPSWKKILFGVEGRENIDKVKCERNVFACVKNSPMVKLMMGALKSSGW